MASHEFLKILHLDSSGQYKNSQSRKLSQYFTEKLSEKCSTEITQRDLAKGLPFVDENWISANFTPDGDRTDLQNQTLELSDQLVQELFDHDILVIGLPVYNFGVPATVKAWIDMVARAKKSFHYTENGPEGLITGKKAYITATSGGTPIGSDYDFATSYMKHTLGFIGITDVEIIAADMLAMQAEEKISGAVAKLDHHVDEFPKAT